MRYDNIHKRPDYLLHSASTRGDKGNPGASLRVVFGRDPLSLHRKRFFIPSQQVFSPSSAGICSLYSSYPGSSLVCLFPPPFFYSHDQRSLVYPLFPRFKQNCNKPETLDQTGYLWSQLHILSFNNSEAPFPDRAALCVDRGGWRACASFRI